jgi:hypothetical protein
MDTPTAADAALELLFKKLHPLLEDTAHALDTGAPREELEKLHARLQRARERAVVVLEGLALTCPTEELADLLEELAGNLSPVGEGFQDALVLTQLCLEQAPEDLLPFAQAEGSWMTRLRAFQTRLAEPAFQAKARWVAVDPELGEEADAED